MKTCKELHSGRCYKGRIRCLALNLLGIFKAVMSLLLVPYLIIASLSCILASNSNETEHRTPLHIQFSRRPAGGSMVKGLPGLESVLGVMGPLALAAMVSLPFVAPAAAALLPLASLSNMFGRRRRHLDDPKDMYPETEALLRRIHAAAIRRNVH